MDDAQRLRANAALEQAVDLAGSESALARLLGVTQGAINQRRKSDNAFLTAEQAVIVEQKIGMPRAVSRPDLFEGIVLAEPDGGSIPIYAGANPSLQEWGAMQAEIVDMTRVVRRSPRPLNILRDRGLYGLLIATTAMSPRFDPGSLVLAERHAPPATGDDVLVHHGTGIGTEVVVARLHAQDADSFTLHQHATGAMEKTGRNGLSAVHRILTINDLIQNVAATLETG